MPVKSKLEFMQPFDISLRETGIEKYKTEHSELLRAKGCNTL